MKFIIYVAMRSTLPLTTQAHALPLEFHLNINILLFART